MDAFHYAAQDLGVLGESIDGGSMLPDKSVPFLLIGFASPYRAARSHSGLRFGTKQMGGGEPLFSQESCSSGI